MRTLTRLAPVSVALVAATLAACSGGAKSDTTAPAPPASTGTASAAAGSSLAASSSAGTGSASGAGASSDLDACKLLTVAQASGQAGRTYASAVSKTIASGQDACTYHPADNTGDLVIIVYQPSSGVGWQMMTSVLTGTGAVKAVSGVGDKAMVGQIELDAQAGQRLVAVQGAGGLLTGDYTKAVTLAKTVIAALPS
jgi:hypothetical protein